MEQDVAKPVVCQYSSFPVTDENYFCPHCGKKLKDKPVSIGTWAIVWLFVLSVLLPPLGIGLTMRYIKADEESTRTIGWISLLVTVVSLMVAIWISKLALDGINQQINSQLENFQF